ncbi:MAG: DUF2193 family protein [Methanosarcinales archaeon]
MSTVQMSGTTHAYDECQYADVVEKTMNEGIAAQQTCVDIVREHRYEPFLWKHCEPFYQRIKEVTLHPDQSKECLDLWRESYLNHYEIIDSLTKTVNALDTAFLEWMQTPIVLDICYKLDRDFKDAIDEFCRTIRESEDLIGIEAMRLHSGFYGIVSSKDFAALPGSNFAIDVLILDRTPIDRKYKEAIMAAKSWGLNTIYVFGDRFTRIVQRCRNVQTAIEQEQRYLEWIWAQPSMFMKKIMGTFGFTSFNRHRYYELYEKRMTPVVEAAYDAGVHIANIPMLPTHVGDMGHHLGPSYYEICKDEMCMNILDAVTQVGASTTRRGYAMGVPKVPFALTGIVTGAQGAAMAEILNWDGFTADMFVDLMEHRFNNWVLTHPYDRPMVAELHINDWLDFIAKGERVIRDPPHGYGGKTMGVPVDLWPIRNNTYLNDPQWYAYPYCAITARTAALFRFIDQPCMLSPEAPSINALCNQTALNPDKAMAPIQLCKRCATSEWLPAKCRWCRANDLKLGVLPTTRIEPEPREE